MELKINEVAIPEQITFNYDELKAELTEKVRMYETLVYSDEQIKEAKADKAALNKLKKALNDERIRREKEYMQPFNDFKAKINEIIGIIDKPVAVIDAQVKSYEDKQKQEKRKKITEYFEERYLNSVTPAPDCFRLERIFDEKWLNASVSMKSIQESIDTKAEQIKNDLEMLSNLPEFGFEAVEIYKSTLDVNKAITEAKRMSEMSKAKAAHEAEMKARAEAEEQARLTAEAEAKKQEEFVLPEQTAEEAAFEAKAFGANPTVEEVGVAENTTTTAVEKKQWVSFKALLTVEQATALKEFFESYNIQFEAI